MRRLAAGLGTILLSVIGSSAVAQLAAPPMDYSGLAAAANSSHGSGQGWAPLASFDVDSRSGLTAETSFDRHGNAKARPVDDVLITRTKSGGAVFLVDENAERSSRIGVNCFTSPGGRQEMRAVDRSIEGEIGSTFAFDDQRHPCNNPRIGVLARGPVPQGDLQFLVAPATSHCTAGNCDVRGLKGEIRLGSDNGLQGTRERGWYVYAGADGTLVLFDERPGDMAIDSLKRTVDVRDTFTMGDMEAGVMVNRGEVDLSVNYVRRQTSYENWEAEFEDNADYLGVKFTID